jgi:hypothetical protein
MCLSDEDRSHDETTSRALTRTSTRRLPSSRHLPAGPSPTVVNAVIDAPRPYGVRHADMPLTPVQVWRAAQGRPLRADLAIG